MTAPDKPDIEQEIEQTRERLGETVDAMAARADVKARARARAAEMKARAAAVSGRVQSSETVRRRWPLAAAGLLAAGTAIIWRRRRSG